MLGLPVHIKDNYKDNYSDWLAQRLQANQGTHVVTLNAEMTMQARQNQDLAQVIKQADLVVPDGSGIVLYLRSQGEEIERCPGIELSEQVVQIAAEHKWRIFLIGGAPNIVDIVVEGWQKSGQILRSRECIMAILMGRSSSKFVKSYKVLNLI